MANTYHPQSTVLEKTVTDARRLLDYAVSKGIIKDTSIITAIVEIEAKLASGVVPEHSDIENFLKAYNTLSEVTGGVSGDSLSPEAEADARHTKDIYIATLVFLLIFLVPISTITLTGKRLIGETLTDINYICDKDKAVDCYGHSYSRLLPQLKKAAEQNEPLKLPPKVQAEIGNDSVIRSSKPLKVQTTSGDSSKSSLVEAGYETDIRTIKIKGRMETVAYAMITFKLPKWVDLQDEPTMAFHATRIYADDVMSKFNFWYDIVAGCLLPIAFAALGAVTFGLRDLRQRLEDKTWTKQGQALPFLRIVIALLVGYLISLFSDFTVKSGLTPIALAFVIGYSVDVFFTFIDSIVMRLKTPLAAPAKPAGV